MRRRPPASARARPWRRPRRASPPSRTAPPSSSTAGLLGVRPDDPDDHRHVAVLLGAGLDQAAGDLVAAGDPAEDVDEDRVDLRVGEDQAHRRRDLVGPRAAADVEEVGRLAAGPLDEVHRGHRQAGPVDHAADRAVELDERQARLARLARRPDPPRRGRAAPRGSGCRAQRRVVEGDLGVEADEALGGGPVGSACRTIASGLISTRSASLASIVRTSPWAIATKHAGGPPRPDRERQLARLAVERARAGDGPATRWIASGVTRATSSISTPPSADAISDDPPARPVEDRAR